MNQTVREFRVRPITRYVVTEWSQTTDDEGRVTHTSTTALGVFDNEEQANRVASALGAPVPSFSNVSFPTMIREIRERNGWTQTQMADHIGVTQATISRWESGEQDPRPSAARMVAQQAIGGAAPTSAPDTFAGRLTYAREKAGLSQSELARRVGVSPSAIQLMEAGVTHRSRYLVTIAGLLGVRPEWLQDGSGPISTKEPE